MTFRYCLQFLAQLPCWVSAAPPPTGSLPANCPYAGSEGASTSSPPGYATWWHRERLRTPAWFEVAIPVPRSRKGSVDRQLPLDHQERLRHQKKRHGKPAVKRCAKPIAAESLSRRPAQSPNSSPSGSRPSNRQSMPQRGRTGRTTQPHTSSPGSAANAFKG
jgi:hypothetical protein